jgi:hypothetical protein
MRNTPTTPLAATEAERLLRIARWLQRGIPVVVVISLPSVWSVWHDQGQRMGIVLLACLLAVEVTSGLYLPWFCRLTVRRRGIETEDRGEIAAGPSD